MTSSSPAASDWFGAIADSYDSLIRRAVPRYEEMLAQIAAYLPAAATQVVELGCGSGNLSVRLAEQWPDVALVIVDASAEMVEVTRAALARNYPRVASRSSFRVARFEDVDLPVNSADVIASSLSLHHVVDMAVLYRRLRATLCIGGRFILADQFLGQPGEIHDINWQGWLAHCRDGRCTEAELEGMVQHARSHDHYLTVARHMHLLAAAGFADVDCVWRHGMWGILTATAA